MDLFVCYEETSHNCLKIIEEINKYKNQKVKAFYPLPWHSFINRMQEDNIENYIDLKNTYKNKNLNDLIDISSSYENINLKNLTIEDLHKLDIYINLEQWQTTDISGRKMHYANKSNVIRYLDFIYGYFKEVIKNNNPNKIFDVDVCEAVRKVLHLICIKNNVNYISLCHSRFQDYILKTTTLAEDLPLEYKYFNSSKNDLDRAKDSIEEFINSKSLLNSDEINFQKKQNLNPFIKLILSIYSDIRFAIKISININREREIIKFHDNSDLKDIFYPSQFKSLIFKLKLRIKLFLAQINKKININKFENYFYYPLNYLNEGISAQTIGDHLTDYEIINKIRISFPFNKKLIIKEHRAMIPERRIRDIKRLKKLIKNSFYYIGDSVNSNSNLSPYNLLNNSLGVIVHSGTSGLEAMLLNKPVLIFGKPIYSQFIPNKVDVNSTEELLKFFRNPQSYITPKNSVYHYIAFVIKFGIRFNYDNIFGYLSNNEAKVLAKFFLEKN